MDTIFVTAVGLLCTILGSVIGYLGFIKNHDKAIKKDTTDDTTIKVELQTTMSLILKQITEMKKDIQCLDKKFDDFKDNINNRLTKLEEMYKYANERIGKLERKEKWNLKLKK